MSTAFGWVVRRIGGATMLTLALLALALGSVALTLSSIVRGLDPDLLLTMSALGAVTGWLLARSRLRGQPALPVALALGFATVLLRVGQLWNQVWTLASAVGRVLWELAPARFTVQLLLAALREPGAIFSPVGIALGELGLGFSPLSAPLNSLLDALLTLAARLELWVRAMSSGQPVYDPVASALVWSFVLWLFACWAAWMVRRSVHPIVALAPQLVLLALVLAYTGRDAMVFVFVIAPALVLRVMLSHLARQRRWQRDHIPYADDLGFDLGIIAVPAIVCILVMVALVPAFSVREIARRMTQWSPPEQNQARALSDSFGLQAAPRPTSVFDPVSSPGLPRSHLLGAGPELLRKAALTIQTSDPVTQDTHYYWLSSTYDLYTGHGWVTSNLEMSEYEANDRALAAAPRYRPLYQTVRRQNGDSLLYAAGSVVSVDHAFQLASRANGDVFAAQTSSNVYRVESLVPAFDADDLRAAGIEYPDWVRARYLFLSDQVPPRVLALARDLTATAPTPYERARAIENYLRTIPYTLDLPTPPGSRDIVDYFLFDLRRGYCDYYATAMAVLARAAGLPARIAVGYAMGTYDPVTNEYRVTEADAHSWAQVYFPEYGWVDFEPTGSRAVFTYNLADAHLDPESFPTDQQFPSSGSPGEPGLQNSWLVLPGILLVMLLILFSLVLADSVRLRRSPPALVPALLYQGVYTGARNFGLPVSASHTPYQVLAMVGDYLAAPPRAKHQAWWSPLASSIREIVESYVQSTYGAHPLTASESAAVLAKWERARFRLWFAIALHALDDLFQRVRSRKAQSP